MITACEKYSYLRFVVIPQDYIGFSGFTVYSKNYEKSVKWAYPHEKLSFEDKLGRLNKSSHGQVLALK